MVEKDFVENVIGSGIVSGCDGHVWSHAVRWWLDKEGEIQWEEVCEVCGMHRLTGKPGDVWP